VHAPIVGATKQQHLTDAINAVDLTLDEKETEALEAPYRPHDVSGHV
jgi:aryl-alcohol dehydrogenase-like predicted oxidoreductase